MKMPYLQEISFSGGSTIERLIKKKERLVTAGFMSKQESRRKVWVTCLPLFVALYWGKRGRHTQKTGSQENMKPFCLLVSLFNESFYSQPPTETFFLSDPIKLLHRNLCQEGRGQRAIRSMTSHLTQCGGQTHKTLQMPSFLPPVWELLCGLQENKYS